MRRGKITKKSIIIIFIVAFFTVFSFLFDQLVIRTEDSMRNLNINFKNIENQRIKYESLSDTFYTTVFESEKALHSVLLARNLLIKSLIYNKFSKEHLYFQHGDPKENVENIKYLMTQRLNEILFHVQEIQNSFSEQFDANEKIIKELNKNQIKDLKNLYNFFEQPIKNSNNYFFSDNTEKYLKLGYFFKYWKNEEDLDSYILKSLEEFSHNDWFDVYRYKMKILDLIDKDHKKLDNFIDIIDKKVDKLYELEDIEFEKIKSLSIKKNYFILCSIISQIFSLLFLLILFRSLIKKEN